MSGRGDDDDDPAVRRGESLWRDFVFEVRGRDRPFAEHWARFQEVYADRPAEAGPPPAWWPEPGQAAGSNLGRFQKDHGFASYHDLHAWSARERAEFWARVIDRLGVRFARRPDRLFDPGTGVEDVRWLPGAEMNIVESCFLAHPERAAIVSGHESSRHLKVTTYGELDRLADRVAGGLAARGLGPGDAVALYLPMTVECVAAYLGIVRAGMAVVSIADSFSAGELGRRIEIGSAKAVVTADRYLRAGREIELYHKVEQASAPPAVVIPMDPSRPPELRSGDTLWRDVLAEGNGRDGERRFRALAGDPYRVTNVLFSSGTTGDPKAIPWTHLTPLKCAMDGYFHHDLRPSDVVAWPTNIGWMMGPWLIYATFLNRATMALFDGSPGGAGFARFVQDARVTMLGVVPSLVRAWRTGDALDGVDWSQVRVFSSTGEPSSREDYLWLMSRAGYRAPVIEYLGGTEIGGGHITGTVVQPASPSTFSTAALGIDFVILGEDGRPVGEGERGELYLIPPSIGMSQALLHPPLKVGRSHHEVYFEGCPAGPRGEVLRRHGDETTRLHRGYFRAQGRADDTMNLGGIKVSALEIERAVHRHPAIHEAAAVAVQPEGEGSEKLVVFAVLAGEASRAGPEPSVLAREVGRILAGELNPLFKVHELVMVDALPRTASGKLMRRELRARWVGAKGGDRAARKR